MAETPEEAEPEGVGTLTQSAGPSTHTHTITHCFRRTFYFSSHVPSTPRLP